MSERSILIARAYVAVMWVFMTASPFLAGLMVTGCGGGGDEPPPHDEVIAVHNPQVRP